MPLKDENRIICSYGLKQMNSNPSPALKTLFKLLKIKTVDSSTIGFQIGPLLMQQDGLQIQILQVKCLETMKQIKQNGLNYYVSTINVNK